MDPARSRSVATRTCEFAVCSWAYVMRSRTPPPPNAPRRVASNVGAGIEQRSQVAALVAVAGIRISPASRRAALSRKAVGLSSPRSPMTEHFDAPWR